MMQDDEKWSSVIGESENTVKNVSAELMMINLKQITVNDYSEQPIKLIPRKTKSDVYFVKDQNTTLSDEDMHYQMINFSLTTEKRPPLPELLKEDFKLPENFAKLFKLPGRSLPPKLVNLFEKKLIKPQSYPDFSIDYKEITEDVKHVREVRRLRKFQCLHRSQSATTIGKSLKINQRSQPIDCLEEISHHQPNHDHNYEKRHNFQDKKNNNKYKNKNIFNDDSSHSLLKKIDSDFKPTILLGTKTYSRKRKIKVE